MTSSTIVSTTIASGFIAFSFLLGSDSGLPVRVDRGLGSHRVLRGGVAVAWGRDFCRAHFCLLVCLPGSVSSVGCAGHNGGAPVAFCLAAFMLQLVTSELTLVSRVMPLVISRHDSSLSRDAFTALGLYAGANVGDNVAIFEQGARHVGKDIAGKGIANPLATLLSTSMMFRHLNLPDFSDR